MTPHAQFAYNTAYHRSIDDTPYYVMFARDPTFKIHEFLDPNHHSAETVKESMAKIAKAREIVVDKLMEHRRAMKAYYDAAIAKEAPQSLAIDGLV